MTDTWVRVWRSCDKANDILRARGANNPPLSESNMPANWQEMKRLHKDLWRSVYGKRVVK